MTRYYDTQLFIEIIESIKGILYLRSDEIGEYKVRFYQGLNGKVCQIDISEEDISSINVGAYLEQLGIFYLYESLFPSQILSDVEDEEIVKD